MSAPKIARVIAVGGGKGGVGKSVIAANLAVAMADTGARVILVDADLGAANQHTLFGISNPGPGLQAFLDHEVESLDSVLLATLVRRLHLIAGTGAVRGAANIPHSQKQRLLRHIRRLEADAVIVDVGAGVHYNALDFFELGSFRLVTMTSQLTSLQNAYAFLKGALVRSVRRLATSDEERVLLDQELGNKETERVAEALRRVANEHPRLAQAIGRELSGFGAQIVGNQMLDQKEVGIFQSVSRMIESFLNLSVPVLAVIPSSRKLHESVNTRRPLCVDGPHDETARHFFNMANTLLQASVPDSLGNDGAVEELPAAEEPPARRAPQPVSDHSAPIPVAAAPVRS